MFKYDVNILEGIFNSLFAESENTVLKSGGVEPVYLPASETGGFHQVISTRDYFASALHEVSHWCIAGKKRRQCIDYGYWYEPDGRSAVQQKEFERVEVKPQALEWIFSAACAHPFRLSVDNLEQADAGASDIFKAAVVQQAHIYLTKGLPHRANLFFEALLSHFAADKLKLDVTTFSVEKLK